MDLLDISWLFIAKSYFICVPSVVVYHRRNPATTCLSGYEERAHSFCEIRSVIPPDCWFTFLCRLRSFFSERETFQYMGYVHGLTDVLSIWFNVAVFFHCSLALLLGNWTIIAVVWQTREGNGEEQRVLLKEALEHKYYLSDLLGLVVQQKFVGGRT